MSVVTCSRCEHQQHTGNCGVVNCPCDLGVCENTVHGYYEAHKKNKDCIKWQWVNTQIKEAGRKDDDGKTRWDLLPFAGLEQVAKVLTFGAKKYAPENWRLVEGWRWRYFRAAIGHLAKWRSGEKLDPESGLPHLAHAACCVLFMLELDA